MYRQHLFRFAILLLVLTSCKQGIKLQDVIGKWNYIKVGKPYSRYPDDTMPAKELAAKSPYINLSANGDMVIMSAGKILSHGKYTVSGNNIIVSEQLPGGKTREFAFYISKLTNTDMVFETKDDDAVRVTARKAE